MLSPLSAYPFTDVDFRRDSTGTDYTPRQSVSHPRNDDEDEDEDEDEAVRGNRAKMRAIDDGGRRPSLPTNFHTSSQGLVNTSVDEAGSSRSRNDVASTMDTRFDGTERVGPSDTDTDHDLGALDTDVELEQGGLESVSQSRAGLDGRPARDKPTLPTKMNWEFESESEGEHQGDSYLVNPAERNQFGGSPVTFARHNFSDEDSASDHSRSIGFSVMEGNFSVLEGSLSVLEGRRGSLPLAIPGRASTSGMRAFDPGETDFMREREGSVTTLRRPSRSLDDDLHSISAGIGGLGVAPSSNPITRADWRAIEEHEASRQDELGGAGVYDGLNLEYILSGSMAGPGSRRSSHSFMQSMPVPPTKGKGKSKSKDKRKGKGKDKEKGKEKERGKCCPNSMFCYC